MSGTPTATATVNSKKRELTSPEFLIDSKKNRFTGSTSESDISELSFSGNMENTGATGGDLGDLDEGSTHVTLSDTHLEKMASLMRVSFEPQMTQIVQESFKSQVSDLISSIVQGVLAGLQSKVDTLTTENAELKTKVEKLESALENAESTLEKAEQYSRRNCLRVSGVPESINEITDDYVCALARAIDVDLSINDIDRSHRLGKPATAAAPRARPRDIVVKFISYRTRAKFYKARVLTKTKGYKGVYINEHLTKSRSKLLYEARRRVKSKQFKSAWSTDGTVMVKLYDADPEANFDGTLLRISSESELQEYVPLPNRKGNQSQS